MFKTINGAAPSAAISKSWRQDRSADELIGICRGVLADGSVNISEANFLLGWIERHREFVDTFPFNAIYHRLRDALNDGVLDSDEERDLLESIQSTVGGEINDCAGSNSLSTTLPFEDPFPNIQHAESTFVLTGTFAFGARSAVKSNIEDRHGKVAGSVSLQTTYIVVGDIGSRDWIHSSYGRKIQHGIDLKQRGATLAIIPESHWAASLAL